MQDGGSHGWFWPLVALFTTALGAVWGFATGQGSLKSDVKYLAKEIADNNDAVNKRLDAMEREQHGIAAAVHRMEGRQGRGEGH